MTNIGILKRVQSEVFAKAAVAGSLYDSVMMLSSACICKKRLRVKLPLPKEYKANLC